jgi:predicted CXXCH cytochrome family protein
MLAALVFATATSGFAQSIEGTPHDFSGETWNASGEICIVCHAPHNNRTTDNPTTDVLWNRDLTGSTFTVYASNTMDATMGQPAGTSKFCLSCHDGTIGLESFGGTTGSTTNLVSGLANLGVDLSNDHPVSIDYSADAALAPTTKTTLLGGTIDSDYLRGGNVECSSCHAVHDEGAVDPFLWVANTGSQFCQECHEK